MISINPSTGANDNKLLRLVVNFSFNTSIDVHR